MTSLIPMQMGIFFQQLFEPESSTYTYIIADSSTHEAAIIDPVFEMVDRDLQIITELNLKLKYILDTHVHADHITAADEIRRRTQAQTAISEHAQVRCADLALTDGQKLFLGDKSIKAISTPGHTNACTSYYFEGLLFTGDTLLIRGCGRTDFQDGSSEKLYDSVHQRIFTLPSHTIIYPAHDYKGKTSSSVEAEKTWNPRLSVGQSKADFVKMMSELKLSDPKKMHEALPANLSCGKLSQ